jgi:hypothetical protein
MRRAAWLLCVSLLTWSCGSQPPTGPSEAPIRERRAAAPTPALSSFDAAPPGPTNSPPELRLRTTPVAVPGNPYPEISGFAPLSVRFNLCQSSDPDQNPDNPEEGDSLTWQFHFGDDGSEAFDPDGSFNPDFEHFCRVEHTYERAGRYVATVTVTDKHLEDQSQDVAASARRVERLTIIANGPVVEPTPLPASEGCQAWNFSGGPYPPGSGPGVSSKDFRAGETISVRFSLTSGTSATVSILETFPAPGSFVAGPVSINGPQLLTWTIPASGTYSLFAYNNAPGTRNVDVEAFCP